MKNIIHSKQLCALLFCIFCFTNINAQVPEVRFLIHGKVIDARTKKAIKRIPITILPYNKVINADNNGAFLFNMPRATYSFVFDYYPFNKQEIKLDLHSDTTLIVELYSPAGTINLDEVEVTSAKLASEERASIEMIDSHTLSTLPAMIGERDIIKAFALTSGVTSSSEGAADMQVRGGVHGQNLYMLDEIPLFSTEHFFGLVSVYNPTIIKSARLYKSDFPAEYGGKISSVVNVMTEDADLTKLKGEAEISMLTTKLGYNIPIIKDKLALTVAGRISNYSLFNIISPFITESDGTRFSVHFGDINANLFWKINEKNKLKLTFFSNTDGINVNSLENKYAMKVWINNNQQNLGLNWYSTISNKAENHLLLYTDVYGFDFGNSAQHTSASIKDINQILTGIKSTGLVDKISYNLSDKIMLKNGASIKMYGFSPFQFNQNDSNINAVKAEDAVRQIEIVGFTQAEYQIGHQQNINVGLRINTVGNSAKMYTNIEPRFGYHGIFKNDFSISGSLGRMTQPIHRVANSGLGLPFEIFLPSSAILLPESSWNFSLGAAKDFAWNKSKFSLKADAWYKTMKNVIEFKDGYDGLYSTIVSTQIAGASTEKYVTQGNGSAYGIDFSAKYKVKQLSVTADYTWMNADYQFEKLNYGRPFSAPTDIRHSLSLTSEIKLSDAWAFTATWQYRSGKPITIPTYIFANPTAPVHTRGFNYYSNSDYQFVETDRNNYRTKPFHKLDVSFTHNYKTRKKHNDASLSLGIYNVYNQANSYLYYIDGIKNADGTFTPVLKSLSIFPILPSFSWSVKF